MSKIGPFPEPSSAGPFGLGQPEEFTMAVLGNVLGQHLDYETPSSRLKQIALMMAVRYLHFAALELSAENLVKATGVARSTLSEVIEPLLRRRLLRETSRRNSIGRGRLVVYEFGEGLIEGINTLRPKGLRI